MKELPTVPASTLLANRRDPRVIRGGIELLETDGEFAIAIQQAQQARGAARVTVHADVYVSDDGLEWHLFQRVWSGLYSSTFDGGLPRMADAELRAIAGPSGARFAELRWCFNPMKSSNRAVPRPPLTRRGHAG